MSKNKNSLTNKWGNFADVIFDPWVVMLIVLTIVLGYHLSGNSSLEENESSTIVIITILLSLVSGVLGGAIATRWAQMTDSTILITRGKSAIRSLKLILLNVSNIEKRTDEYINMTKPENEEHKLIVNNFQEVIEKCNIVSEEIISSIENWTDIIPEVSNLKTQIGLVTKMKEQEVILIRERNHLKEKLTEVAEENVAGMELLSGKLAKTEEKLKNVSEKLVSKENELGSGILGGLTSSSFLNTAPWRTKSYELRTINKCDKCGSFLSYNALRNSFNNCDCDDENGSNTLPFPVVS